MDSGLLAVRRSNHSAKSHPLSYTWIGHGLLGQQQSRILFLIGLHFLNLVSLDYLDLRRKDYLDYMRML